MAMNLRLDDAHDELLEALAAQERRSKTEVIKMAIEERAAKANKSARTRAIFERILQEDAELLDALSK
jgi:predicted transcriptional regulator